MLIIETVAKSVNPLAIAFKTPRILDGVPCTAYSIFSPKSSMNGKKARLETKDCFE